MTEAKLFLQYVGINNNEQEHITANFRDIETYKLPSAWYNSENTSLFVDVPMHLLMLGVVKSVMFKIGKSLLLINQTPVLLKW
jgi:hypothetical protein